MQLAKIGRSLGKNTYSRCCLSSKKPGDARIMSPGWVKACWLHRESKPMPLPSASLGPKRHGTSQRASKECCNRIKTGVVIGIHFVACLSPLTTDHTSLSRRSSIPIVLLTDTSNIWAFTRGVLIIMHGRRPQY